MGSGQEEGGKEQQVEQSTEAAATLDEDVVCLTDMVAMVGIDAAEDHCGRRRADLKARSRRGKYSAHTPISTASRIVLKRLWPVLRSTRCPSPRVGVWTSRAGLSMGAGGSKPETGTRTGVLEGRIFDLVDVEIELDVDTLGFDDAEDLIEDELPPYTQVRHDFNVPDNYFAIISPGGHYRFGRGGNISDGTSNNNLVAWQPANARAFSNAFNTDELESF